MVGFLRSRNVQSESYARMKARQQSEFNAFSDAHVIWAFSDDALYSQMRSKFGLDPDQTRMLTHIGGGGYMLKSEVQVLRDLSDRHERELRSAMDADRDGTGFLVDAMEHELANHEYGYTGDADPGLRALGLSWYQVMEDPRLKRAFRTAESRMEVDW